jgi:iron complex transport system ATP-binding protein
MIEFKNVHIGYEKPLFQIDNLRLNPVQLYVLIGRNGSGKSTLLSTITGETKPINGHILIENQDISAFTQKDKSQKISVVLSHNGSIPFLTVREYISLGRYPYTNMLGKLSKADESIIDTSIHKVGIEKISDKYTTAISDGERQLAAIARALAQDTSIILMDEPTAFLDYGNRIKVFKILKELAKTENKCILLSSHDIDLCLDFDLPLLLIDEKAKKLIELEPNTPKTKILEIGFGIY